MQPVPFALIFTVSYTLKFTSMKILSDSSTSEFCKAVGRRLDERELIRELFIDDDDAVARYALLSVLPHATRCCLVPELYLKIRMFV